MKTNRLELELRACESGLIVYTANSVAQTLYYECEH